jgi:hypothetical protein
VRLLARGQIEFGRDEPAEHDHVNDALAYLGLYAEGGITLNEDEYWLWPENDEAFSMWLSVQTQWNAGMGGATGLNYPGVETCLRLRGLKKKAQQKLFLLIQMMERACLEEWARKRNS